MRTSISIIKIILKIAHCASMTSARGVLHHYNLCGAGCYKWAIFSQVIQGHGCEGGGQFDSFARTLYATKLLHSYKTADSLECRNGCLAMMITLHCWSLCYDCSLTLTTVMNGLGVLADNGRRILIGQINLEPEMTYWVKRPRVFSLSILEHIEDTVR